MNNRTALCISKAMFRERQIDIQGITGKAANFHSTTRNAAASAIPTSKVDKMIAEVHAYSAPPDDMAKRMRTFAPRDSIVPA